MKYSSKTLLILLLLCTIASGQYQEADWDYRDQWMDVDRIFRMAGITPGDHVADIGCHEGYLSMHLARTVGKSGQVYSVDVRQDRLETLEENARSRDLTNIRTILGDYDNPHLPKAILDVVLIVDTYHEMKSYMTVLEHVKKALKPEGRILILEKLKAHARNKSREEQVRSHTLSSKYVKRELKEAGFEIVTEIGDLGKWEEENDKTMWLVVASKM
ncbi:class I SAM-dependent methyltransferase [Lentiprolixibacter aurantiacus]|uniref:Methyltransferase domain-containing protein n=1 Tax=Lentiprolixibacter aurantiacus TaxID=2993939 RepID=A0AAE3SNJ7_9FLAO|nr:methyltransferase domain-containing protein [Lentiprolixibacter aurantiacus]MCX2719610.1 methyltransferase domain-containing protein [Lentiprolixibacter aurantiacus]